MNIMKIKKRPLVISGALLGIVLVGAAVHAADPKQKDAVVHKPALTVTTDKPQSAKLSLKLSANGNVAAWQETIIGAEISGLRLSEVRVNVGDTVKQGDVLAVFAADTVQADLAQIKAGVAEAEANAAAAAGNAERARGLQATGALSEQQINQYITTEHTAKAKLEAQRAMAKVQQLRLAQTQVLAPDSGVISARSATVGAVMPSGQEMFRMIRQGRLEWRAEVTADEMPRIKQGAVASIATASGAIIKGKVRIVAPTVDPQTRSGLVYVDLPAASQLKAGMFAKGEFELGSSDGLTVPQQSVVVRDGFSYVFQLGADNRVAQVKVQTGRRNGDRLEVLSGIKVDAVLVTSGAGFLNDGDLVKVVAAPAAPANPAKKAGA